MARRKSSEARTKKPKAKKSGARPRTIKRTVQIVNSLGLHARPAALFVQTANQFAKCRVIASNATERVNGKSIMGMMTLAAAHGTELTIEVSGDEAEQTLEALCQLIANKFDEE